MILWLYCTLPNLSHIFHKHQVLSDCHLKSPLLLPTPKISSKSHSKLTYQSFLCENSDLPLHEIILPEHYWRRLAVHIGETPQRDGFYWWMTISMYSLLPQKNGRLVHLIVNPVYLKGCNVCHTEIRATCQNQSLHQGCRWQTSA